ncbi:MAG: hypothetical protein KIT27_00775 [Legionellales bacterium]|nr:hypothetical protein [Legionellales bacterium]
MAEQPNSNLGDLRKTNIIYQLCQIPVARRDEAWSQHFLTHVAAASFRCGEPQVITGPDGFPYFQLLLPEPGKHFECFVIEKMVDDFLLANGLGIVINPSGDQPDWVFTYGDILNFKLNKEFYSPHELFNIKNHDEVFPSGTHLVVGEPAQSVLPDVTRNILREFFKGNGILSPKVSLIMEKTHDGIQKDLAFNITPQDFKNEPEFRQFLQALGWYFPRHYSIMGKAENPSASDFKPL